MSRYVRGSELMDCYKWTNEAHIIDTIDTYYYLCSFANA